MEFHTIAAALERWNAGQGQPELDAALIEPASRRLAVYGSLAPGKENHWVLEPLSGSWREGVVHGVRMPAGWGIGIGYPGLVWNPVGPEVPAMVFESEGLPDHWDRIDEFEGPDYRRILVPVVCGDEVLVANLYAVRGEKTPAADPTDPSPS